MNNSLITDATNVVVAKNSFTTQTSSLTATTSIDESMMIRAKRQRYSLRGFLATMTSAFVLGVACSSAFAVKPSTNIDMNQAGISGTWYDPAASGQGFVISVTPNADGQGHAGYFGGWFTFADHWSGEWYGQTLGSPMWLTLQGTTAATDPNYGVRLEIFDNDGRTGNFAALPAVPASKLGYAYVSMTDCTHMHLHYTVQWRADFVDPQWLEMDLQRLMPNVACVDTQTPPAAIPGYRFSAAWYDPATSGQGFAFEINPAVSSAPGWQALFGGWFTYAPVGADQSQKGRRWYTLQGEVSWGYIELVLPAFLTGSDIGIYETSGGMFATPNSPGTLISRRRVGTANVRFGTSSGGQFASPFSCARAYVSYSFDAGENAGRSGEISLQRLGPAPESCGLW